MELTSVTVDLGTRRLDVCVPGHAPVAELLPELLRHGSVPAGGEAAGWEVRLLDGRRVAADRGLDEQGIPDGTVLYLVPSTVDWPDWECDDVVEAVAAEAGGAGRAWTPAHTRAATLAVAGGCLAAGPALCLRGTSGPASGPLVAAALLGLCGTAAARRDPASGHLLTACGAAYAVAGAALVDPGTGAGRLLLASAALLLYAALGWAAAAGLGGLCAALATAGLAGLLGAALAAPLGPAGAAAVVLCAAVLSTPALPALAVRLGRLPVPVPGAAAPDLPALRRAVARADGALTGLLAGAATVVLAAGVPLAAVGGPVPAAYLAACGTVLLLRARNMAALRHRLPPLAAGLAGYGLAGWALLAAGAPTGVTVAGPVAVALALVALASPREGRTATPYLGRVLDLVDTGATVALVPLACAAIGLYGRVAALLA